MNIKKGNWPFCTCGIYHDDAKYYIEFSKNNGAWLCTKCYEELKQLIS